MENGFKITAFCSVVRPEDHPFRPSDYRSNNDFWKKRGVYRTRLLLQNVLARQKRNRRNRKGTPILDQGMEVTIALAQYPITYHNSLADWKNHTEKWISDACNQGAQILTFPEYGSMELTSLFSEAIQSDLKLQIVHLQELLPFFLETFQEFARKYSCVIVAPSFPVASEDRTVNRCFVFTKMGHSYQDKHFMTRFEDESWGISSSDGALRVFETSFGKFGIQICFDMEFPIGGPFIGRSRC